MAQTDESRTVRAAMKRSIPLFLPSMASALCGVDDLAGIDMTKNFIRTISPPIALFMMVYMGLKWITSDGPEDRENARRGIIYIFIALLIINAGESFVRYLVCPS